MCAAIFNGNFIDLIEIDAASNTGVDNVRELIEHVRFAPSSGKYKVFIIDEVHMLSKGAFNALLKTLEEPPTHVIFVLATTEAVKVPATIISRTQRFDFKRLSLAEVENHLNEISNKENLELPKEAIQIIAQTSEGGLRDALSLLDKVSTLGPKPSLEEVLQLIGVTDTAHLEKLLALIAQKDASAIPAFIDQLLEKGTDFVAFNRDFLEYLRKVLILKITESTNLVQLSEEHIKATEKLASAFGENEIIFIIRLFLRSLKEQGFAPAPDLPVLLAAVEAAGKSGGKAENSKPAIQTESRSSFRVADAAPRVSVSQIPENPNSPQTEKVEAQVSSQSLVNISNEEILARWQEVIEKLKEINGPLAQLLKSSNVESLRGASIIVSVKYNFHKQNLEHPKNQITIGKILKDIYGHSLAVRGEVAKMPEEKSTVPGGLSDALKVFGGEFLE